MDPDHVSEDYFFCWQWPGNSQPQRMVGNISQLKMYDIVFLQQVTPSNNIESPKCPMSGYTLINLQSSVNFPKCACPVPLCKYVQFFAVGHPSIFLQM